MSEKETKIQTLVQIRQAVRKHPPPKKTKIKCKFQISLLHEVQMIG